MGKTSAGKAFESDFKESCKGQRILVVRLNDSSLSWQHERVSKFTAKNPFDFIVYQTPGIWAVECKSTTYKSMSIQRSVEDSEKMIKAHQIQSLINFSAYDGAQAGFLLNFRNDDNIQDNITYWMPIDNFSQFLADSDKQSINKLDCVDYGAYVVKQKLKRTRYVYDMEDLIQHVYSGKEA